MTIADKLRGLMQGATRGPWGVDSMGTIRGDDPRFPGEGLGQFMRLPPGVQRVRPNVPDDVPTANANQDLIVASVNLLPALAAVVEAAKAGSESCSLCRGTGRFRVACFLCDVSGEDHVCDDSEVDCTVSWCVAMRAALSALDAAVAREVG